ncbi:MAG: hypothetical protein P9M03_00325 [Candidatus Theseobacter exili]|nr:hypothetical protein [Candidatus Theseobacter exili]
MKLSNYRETYYILSGKASDVARQLAFAGIALVWIFKQEARGIPEIPTNLILPSALLASALAFDLLQYIWASAIWGGFQKYHEKKRGEEEKDPDLIAPNWFNWPTLTFFWFKLVFVITAYFLIIKYILSCWL